MINPKLLEHFSGGDGVPQQDVAPARFQINQATFLK